MPGFEHGLKRAIQGLFSGMIIGIIFKTFSNIGILDKHLVTILLILMGISSTFDLLSKMKYWSTPYILGFIIGYLSIIYTMGLDVFVAILLLFAAYIIINRMFRHLADF